MMHTSVQPETGVQNPWTALGDGPLFVHPDDAPVIDGYREFVPDAERSHSLHLRRLPEPCYGPLRPKVLLMLLNPGVGGTEPELPPGDPAIDNFRIAMREHDIPHRHLGSHVPDGDGPRWWRATIAPLVRATRLSEDHIAARLGMAQFVPYASRTFGHAHLRLPTQAYAFWRVRQAMDAGAILVVRGLQYWFGAIPELRAYRAVGRLLVFTNPRAVFLSPGCIGGADAFQSVVHSLHES